MRSRISEDPRNTSLINLTALKPGNFRSETCRQRSPGSFRNDNFLFSFQNDVTNVCNDGNLRPSVPEFESQASFHQLDPGGKTGKPFPTGPESSNSRCRNHGSRARSSRPGRTGRLSFVRGSKAQLLRAGSSSNLSAVLAAPRATNQGKTVSGLDSGRSIYIAQVGETDLQ